MRADRHAACHIHTFSNFKLNNIMKTLHRSILRALLCSLAVFCAFLVPASLCSAQSFPEIITRPVVSTGLQQPVQVVHAGDGTNRLFIVQQGGTIKVLDRTDDENFVDRGVFFNIGSIPNTGEQGLLSMAFDPNYSANKRFYVFYTNSDGNLEISRYETGDDPYRADMSTKHILITIPHPTYSNHNGGEMHFGPGGFLYVSTGDGGSGGDPSNNAQNTGSYLGKLLRLDVNNTNLIPADNPFPNSLVYAYGLRNPFRWSFDRLNNDVWIGDVGQNAYEEINSIIFSDLKGANFGWRCYEGNAAYREEDCDSEGDYVFPVKDYEITDTTKSVIGGVVYRGSAFPELYGYYIGTDYYSKKIHIISKDNSFAFNDESVGIAGIADFGESENGELYAVGRGTNTLYRIAPPAPMPVRFTSFRVIPGENNGALLLWTVTESGDFSHYEIQRSNDAVSFSTLGNVSRKDASGETADYSFKDEFTSPGELYYYRIKAWDLDGTFQYSTIASFSATVAGNQPGSPARRYILPNIIGQGKINISLTDPFDRLELISLSGQTIQKFGLESRHGEIVLDAGNIPSGIYLARLISPGRVVTEKVIFP